MIKRFLIVFVLLALVVGGLVGFNLFRDRAIEQFFANMPVAAVAVSTATAEPAPWTPTVDAIGTVSAVRGVELTVETTGIVSEVNFRANQKVAANDVLLRLDDAVQAADLEAGRTQAALDKQSLERARELQNRGVGSISTLEQASAAAATSQAQVAKLEAVLQQKQLRAPFAGTIGIPRVDEGQYLAPGTTVATLQDFSTMRADFTVPEQQLHLLEIGQPVVVAIDGIDDRFNGKVTGIDPRVDPASRLVSVRAEIENPQDRLTPGQFVRVEVVLPKEDDIIALPQTALVTSLYGDYVYVVREQEKKEGAAAPEGGEEAKEPTLEVRQIFVQAGRRADGRVEIREGVSAGDQVVTAGQNRLNNGTVVTIDNTVVPGGSAAPTQAAN
ncbi:MAG TPA: efflux RND transporter periplasmic adaptor subunit [Rhizobiaceae bacterium]|nr:efflux RND transporter periplasmic adaptor subunit [Rhizobiaceae bacterium]